MIVIISFGECAWAQRARMHCTLLDMKFNHIKWTRGDTKHQSRSKIDFSKPFPQIFIDGDYIGGYYELVERFPV